MWWAVVRTVSDTCKYDIKFCVCPQEVPAASETPGQIMPGDCSHSVLMLKLKLKILLLLGAVVQSVLEHYHTCGGLR